MLPPISDCLVRQFHAECLQVLNAPQMNLTAYCECSNTVNIGAGELDELEREEFFRLKKVQNKKKRDDGARARAATDKVDIAQQTLLLVETCHCRYLNGPPLSAQPPQSGSTATSAMFEHSNILFSTAAL